MSLFSNISEVKDFIGGGANVSIEMDSINPVMEMTAARHLIPWLGAGQWQDLVDNFAAPDAFQEALLPYVRRPLAMLSFFEYAHIGGVQFSEAGIFRVETDDMKSAYKYQENQYKDWMLLNGYEAIDQMLRFLDDNQGDYPLWTADNAFNRHLSLFINYASDFRDIYSQYLSRYTFDLVRPIIEDVEIFAILPLLGKDQFEAIKAGILAKDLTAAELALLDLIQRAVADFAIKEGIERHWVRIEGRNIIQSERLEPQSYEKTTSAAGNAISLKIRHQDLTANRHMSRLIDFLTDNIDDYPLYEAYQEALAEAAEAAAEEEELCTPADWPRHSEYCCSYYPHCACSTTPKKGVVRL